MENGWRPGDWDFVSGANEHEMGHGFGLQHVCGTPIAPASSTATNIMQTHGSNCCCECGKDKNDTGGGWDTGVEWPMRDHCNDCSEPDTGAGYVPSAACQDDLPGVWDDCADCGGELRIGTRGEPFSNSEDYNFGATTGQVDKILETAISYCDCNCEVYAADVLARHSVKAEAQCTSGSGEFALIMQSRQDVDDDDDGFVTFVPVLIDGDHLGRLSWITSVDVTDFGDFTKIAVPTAGNPLVFGTDPDDLDSTDLEVFSSSRDSATFSTGEVATAYPWAADEEFDMTETEYEWPVVDLVWACDSSDYKDEDVYKQPRPTSLYNLATGSLYGSWDQDIHLRPIFSELELWVEIRGNPRTTTVIPLTSAGNGEYDFSFDGFGLTMDGYVKKFGQPLGSKLRVHIDDGSYRSHTWSNENHDALKVP